MAKNLDLRISSAASPIRLEDGKKFLSKKNTSDLRVSSQTFRIHNAEEDLDDSNKIKMSFTFEKKES